MNVVGYQLGGPTGRGYFFEPEDLPSLCCPSCQRLVKHYRPKLVTLKDYLDFCST